MDPITKALHETWKTIVTEEKYEIPRGGVIEPSDYFKKQDINFNDVGAEKGPDGKWNFVKKPKPTPGYRIDPNLIDLIRPKPTPGDRIPGLRPTIFPEPKPKPTPTPGDGSWGGSKPTPGTGAWGGGQPKKPKYGPDGNFIGFDDGTTPEPTPKPTRKKDEFIPYINPNPSPRPDYYEKKPMYVTGSLPSMPKIYEERDTEGQMAIGELKVLAQKAQELAGMMKDDTQLEGWVQSKITKAKDYISSVHDYMNGNPDKID
jgi:hypothetical protein